MGNKTDESTADTLFRLTVNPPLTEFANRETINKEPTETYTEYYPIIRDFQITPPGSLTNHIPTYIPTSPTPLKDKRGKRSGSSSKANTTVAKISGPNEKSGINKNSRPKKYFPVKNFKELFHIELENELTYSCNICKVGTKLPKVFNIHLNCPKHIDNIARIHSKNNSFKPYCQFCNKAFSIHNFKTHLTGAKHKKNYNKYIAK